MLEAAITGWAGYVLVVNQDGSTELLKNRIMNAALAALRNALVGPVDLGLKYMAFGADATPNDDSMTKLGAEQFRTPFVELTPVGTGQLRSVALLLDSEAVFHIREIGIFAGPEATAATNSGLMISRILWDRDKTGQESIQFIRTDELRRG